MGDLEADLTKEKEKNLLLINQLNKLKKELGKHKKTIENYRKAATDMQKDFFTGAGAGVGTGSVSSIGVSTTQNYNAAKDANNVTEEQLVS